MDHSSLITVLSKQDKPMTSRASIENVMPLSAGETIATGA